MALRQSSDVKMAATQRSPAMHVTRMGPRRGDANDALRDVASARRRTGKCFAQNIPDTGDLHPWFNFIEDQLKKHFPQDLAPLLKKMLRGKKTNQHVQRLYST